MVVCPECVVGYHWECRQRVNGVCCCANVVDAVVEKVRGAIKEPGKITDIESTGRKRAAQLYPIYEGMACEWRNLFYAGGGVIPIVGCRDGLARARHHGPDKNTINNSPTNLHRICHDCHNRWHAVNDEFYPVPRPHTDVPYVPTAEFIQHDGVTLATEVEVVLSGVWFDTKTKTEPYTILRQRFEDERLISNDTIG